MSSRVEEECRCGSSRKVWSFFFSKFPQITWLLALGTLVLTFLLVDFCSRYLYESGAEVNGKDKYGLTPLHYACMRGMCCRYPIHHYCHRHHKHDPQRNRHCHCWHLVMPFLKQPHDPCCQATWRQQGSFFVLPESILRHEMNRWTRKIKEIDDSVD